MTNYQKRRYKNNPVGFVLYYGTLVVFITSTTSVDAYSLLSSSVLVRQGRKQRRSSSIISTKSLWKGIEKTKEQKQQQKTSTTLFHMGHSHSHHHDDHKETTKRSKQQRRRKTSIMWVCSLVLTCCRRFFSLRQQRGQLFQLSSLFPKRDDLFAFVITGLVMMLSDNVFKSVRNCIEKLKSFQENIVKHSSSTATTTISSSTAAQQQKNREAADRVTWIGVVVNLLLSVGKFGVGITQKSSVLVADAGHSLSDLISDFITLWSVRVARLPPDDDHPYGHDKFESIGSLFLSLTLLTTGFSVGVMSYKQLGRLWSVSAVVAGTKKVATQILPVPGIWALVMAGASIASKEWLYRITKVVGERIQSPVVIANAWHHRSDAYSSVLALVSIFGARMGFPAADGIAGMMIAGMICTTGAEVLFLSVQQLSDSADPQLHKRVSDAAQLHRDCDVTEVLSIKTRRVGSSSFCDIVLQTPPKLSMTAAQAVEDRWKEWITQSLRAQDDDSDSNKCFTISVSTKPKMLLPCPLIQALKTSTPSSTTTSMETNKEEKSKTTTLSSSKEETPADSDTTTTLSAGHIELLTRQQALLLAAGTDSSSLHQYPLIRSVTVHYNYDGQTVVDVKVRMISDDNNNEKKVTLQMMEEDVRTIKNRLEEKIFEIDRANIYLDLLSTTNADETNEDDISDVMKQLLLFSSEENKKKDGGEVSVSKKSP